MSSNVKMSKSQSCGKRRGMLEQNSGCVGAFIVLPVVSNFNTSLVQLDEKGTNCTNNPWTGLAYKNVIDITNVTNGSSVESVYCPNYTTTQFLHKLHPKNHRGKIGFSKLGSYVSIFAVMSKISCDVIYQCFRGPHSRSSAEKNTIVKNHWYQESQLD